MCCLCVYPFVCVWSGGISVTIYVCAIVHGGVFVRLHMSLTLCFLVKIRGDICREYDQWTGRASVIIGIGRGGCCCTNRAHAKAQHSGRLFWRASPVRILESEGFEARSAPLVCMHARARTHTHAHTPTHIHTQTHTHTCERVQHALACAGTCTCAPCAHTHRRTDKGTHI